MLQSAVSPIGRRVTPGDGWLAEAQSQGRRKLAGSQEKGAVVQAPEASSRKGAAAEEAAAQARRPRARQQAAAAPRPARPKARAPASRRQGDAKGAAKTPIKSAKQALELLEAKVAEVKAKGKRGRRGGKDAWLIPAEMPKEDAETRRTRLKNLIKLGKERGFLTYAEINDHLPDDLVDAEQIEAIIATFNDMGIPVYDQAPDAETLLLTDDGADRRHRRGRRGSRRSRAVDASTPNSAAPPTRCACTCARWARSSC